MAQTDVLITGIGCITPIGFNREENLASLRIGKCGLERAKIFQSKYASEFYFGEVDADEERLRSWVDVIGLKGITRTDLLAMKAFAEAVADAGLAADVLSEHETAFISASTVGGMCRTNQLYDDSNLKSETTEFLESYSGHAHALQICRKHRLKGLVDVINTACSSSANAIMNGARLIRSGRAKRVIVGGVDSLSKYTVNGFNSLQILSPERCAPFDAGRQGLNLGEAAGYLVLESGAQASGKKVYAKVSGYGNSNDAFHASSMSDNATGILRAMRDAVQVASIEPGQVNYINAHGTGTQNNDQVELVGFKSFFETVPPFSSTKSFVGHTLGAAGAIEAIYSILGLVHGEMYANLNFKIPVEGFNLAPLTQMTKADLRYVMSNSYGFSGNCTSLIFQRV
ncbi:MAG: beta-ketoacyl-[acyl-carrier-protein] synthase family protein [Breznakibacter sp.]